jgi:transcriptional regulator with XRE-family HTH domain
MKESKRDIELRASELVQRDSEFLDALINLRKSGGISQETVADRMGITQPAVAAFEREDSNPTLSSIRRYALAVGAKVNYEVSSAFSKSSEKNPN